LISVYCLSKSAAQGVDALAGVGVEKRLGNERHHLVAVIAPRERGARLSCRERKRTGND